MAQVEHGSQIRPGQGPPPLAEQVAGVTDPSLLMVAAELRYRAATQCVRVIDDVIRREGESRGFTFEQLRRAFDEAVLDAGDGRGIGI